MGRLHPAVNCLSAVSTSGRCGLALLPRPTLKWHSSAKRDIIYLHTSRVSFLRFRQQQRSRVAASGAAIAATMASAELIVAKTALSGALFRADPRPCARDDIESMLALVNSTIAECSPPNVQV